MNHFIEPGDNPNIMALKRALGIALSKPAKDRDKVDLENLTDFFSKYKFFKNLA
jgi:hypothetical protein